MRAYFATTYKERHARSSSLSDGSSTSLDSSIAPKDLIFCPRCENKQAFVLQDNTLINQGGILIHVKQLYCMHCEETYGIPL